MHNSTAARAPRPTRAATATATALLTLVLAVSAVPAAAQPVLGAGDDATLPAKGQVRARGRVDLGRFDHYVGEGGDRPLGAAFSTDSFGVAQIPRFAAARDTLRAITNNAALGLSLGTVNVNARATTITVPVLVEYGVTRRFAVSLLVPFVRTRTAINPLPNATGAAGNFGLNPSIAGLSGSSYAPDTVVRHNGRVVAGLIDAASRARAAGATSLADSLQRVALGVRSLYGDSVLTGSRVIPLRGSAAQRAVEQRLYALNGSIRRAGVAGLDTTLLPIAADARIGIAGYRRILGDSAFGIAERDSLRSVRRESIGDVELTASFQWLDTFGRDAALRVPAAERARLDTSRHVPNDPGLRARVSREPGLRMRSTLTAGWRFGTGNAEIPSVLLDVRPATGAGALLVRSATDVAAGAHLSASGIVRLTSPVSQDATRRLGDARQNGYLPYYRTASVARTLGRELEVEVTPRYALGEAFALVGQGLVRTRQDDKYTGTFTATAAQTGASAESFDADVTGAGTGFTETRLGFGAAYSTLSAWARGRSRLPVEVSLLHTVTTAGSGGLVPRLTTDQLSIRLYAQILGR